MDPRGLPMYQHHSMAMMRQPDIGSVPGSIPINHPMGNPVQGTIGMQGVPMYHNHVNFTQERHPVNLNKIPEQQNCSQVSLQKEFDNERRVCDVLPENPAHPPSDVNNAEDGEIPLENIKTEEEEDISNFMETAHDIFLKIGSKELTVKEASTKLGRPYSFVYSRYQEFCDIVTGKGTIERKNKAVSIKRGKKKKRKKKTGRKDRSIARKIFQCEECPATFNTAFKIKEHSKVHLPNNESHLCTACGIVFAQVFHLMKHRVEAHDEALQCPHCEKSFTIAASYKNHVRSHSGVKPFVCDECGKAYTTKANLQTHYRNHTGERPFMCGFCEKTFTSLNNLNDHLHVHTGGRKKPKRFECKECGHKSKNKGDLQEHMNTHTGAKPYVCDLCGSRFNFQKGLQVHKMTHTGLKPYKCDYCPYAFNQVADLERHKMSHSGIKPFQCHLCDFSCTRRLRLEYHINTHTGAKPFRCDFYGCTSAYSAPTTLKHHKLSHGPPPPKICSACNAEFPDRTSLKQHMMIHASTKANTCHQCFKVFYDEFSLKEHMLTHNMEKPQGQKKKKGTQRKRNPGVKRAGKSGITQKKSPSRYQAPVVAHNGHSSMAQSWTINAEDTKSHSQFQSFAASQYSNLVNNAWPTTMDPEELRLRLISNLK